eukprot:TRINITY_DN5802_c0_g3_i1.p1 TRINITY_DN5802_c0_g3~~TRINITY_DN5802_c0_g3_i1.p1  ORF type:complete len:246 (-),score=40.27 TRINITY_DN5802_c0_g3_i1:57-794(-)
MRLCRLLAASSVLPLGHCVRSNAHVASHGEGSARLVSDAAASEGQEDDSAAVVLDHSSTDEHLEDANSTAQEEEYASLFRPPREAENLSIPTGPWRVEFPPVSLAESNEEERRTEQQKLKNKTAPPPWHGHQPPRNQSCRPFRVEVYLSAMHSYYRLPTCANYPFSSGGTRGADTGFLCGACDNDGASQANMAKIDWNIPGCTTRMCIKDDFRPFEVAQLQMQEPNFVPEAIGPPGGCKAERPAS